MARLSIVLLVIILVAPNAMSDELDTCLVIFDGFENGFHADSIQIRDEQIVYSSDVHSDTTSFLLPTHRKYTITVYSRFYTVLPDSVTEVYLDGSTALKLSALRKIVLISGTVRCGSTPLGSLRLYVMSEKSTYCTTNSKGYYSAKIKLGDSLLLVPKRDGYIFTPAECKILIIEAQREINFLAEIKLIVLKGKVYEKTKELSGVRVSLTGAKSDSIVTGVDGQYSFSVPALATYRITAFHPWYHTLTDTISINAPTADKSKNIYLQRDSINLVAVVNDAAAGVPGIQVTLNGDQIESGVTSWNGSASFRIPTFVSCSVSVDTSYGTIQPTLIICQNTQYDTILHFKVTSRFYRSPTTVEPLSNTAISGQGQIFRWSAGNGFPSYRFQIAKDSSFKSLVADSIGSGTALVINNIPEEFIFAWWRIGGVNENNAVYWSGAVKVFLRPAAVLLTSPAGRQQLSPVAVLFDWESSALAVSYNFQVAIDPLFNDLVLERNVKEHSTSIDTLAHDSRFYWRVRPEGEYARGVWSDTREFITLVAPPRPPIPEYPVESSGVISFPCHFRWNPIDPTSWFELSIGYDRVFTIPIFDTIVTTPECTVKIVPNGSQIWWRVRSSNTAGHGAWSDACSFTARGISGIHTDGNEIPGEFSLSQNYPNPFNPTTTIHFGVSKYSFVTLILYNLLGEEVSRLIDDTLEPGMYTVDWQAKGSASGTYFYVLTAGNYRSVKRLTILK